MKRNRYSKRRPGRSFRKSFKRQRRFAKRINSYRVARGGIRL